MFVVALGGVPRLAGQPRVCLAGVDDVAHAEVAEVVLDGFLAVATVGGDRGGWAAGACAGLRHSCAKD